jgi:hypothetical protein
LGRRRREVPQGFGRFLYGFYIGDDWKTAASVVAALGIAAVLVATRAFGDTAIALIVSAGISLAFAANLIVDVRSRHTEHPQHGPSPR